MKKRDKLKVFKFMKQSKEISGHLPETQKLTKSSLWNFMKNHGDIIVKPNSGRRGRGVIRATSIGKDAYKIHTENIRKIVHGKERTYRYIKGTTGSRSYIVQRRIPLATVDKRPMDVRIIVQRKKNSDTWKVTANIIKVAGEGYIVTNIKRSKGTVLPIKSALRKSSLKDHSERALVSKVKRVALQSAKELSKLYPHHRIFGFDMGLDREGRAWIIEANRFPMMSHFRKLKDKTMYQQIMKYKRG
jgi:hypothetical protein